jgi:hypothetical protein
MWNVKLLSLMEKEHVITTTFAHVFSMGFLKIHWVCKSAKLGMENALMSVISLVATQIVVKIIKMVLVNVLTLYLITYAFVSIVLNNNIQNNI